MTTLSEKTLVTGLAVLPPYCSTQMWADLTGQTHEAVKKQVTNGKIAVLNLSENMPDARRRHIVVNVRKEIERAEKSEF